MADLPKDKKTYGRCERPKAYSNMRGREDGEAPRPRYSQLSKLIMCSIRPVLRFYCPKLDPKNMRSTALLIHDGH